MRFSVRPATANDWSAARDLRIAMLRDTPHAFGDRLEDVLAWDDERWRVRAASMTMPDAVWFVAVDDDGWLGQMAGRDYGGEAWLVEVYVSPSLRGTGAARQLLREIEAWAMARGHDRLHLEVNEHSTAARRFYLREGFTGTGAASPHPLYPDHTEFGMVKLLHGSQAAAGEDLT